MFLKKREHKVFVLFLAALLFSPHVEVKESSFLSPVSGVELHPLYLAKRPHVQERVVRVEMAIDEGEMRLAFTRLLVVEGMSKADQLDILNYAVQFYYHHNHHLQEINDERKTPSDLMLHLIKKHKGDLIDLRIKREDGSWLFREAVKVSEIPAILLEDLIVDLEERWFSETSPDILNSLVSLYSLGVKEGLYPMNWEYVQRIIDSFFKDPEDFDSAFFLSLLKLLKSFSIEDAEAFKKVGEWLLELNRYDLLHGNYYSDVLEPMWTDLRARAVDGISLSLKPDEKRGDDQSVEGDIPVVESHLKKISFPRNSKLPQFPSIEYVIVDPASVVGIELRDPQLNRFTSLPEPLTETREPQQVGKYTFQASEHSGGFGGEIWLTRSPEKKRECEVLGPFIVWNGSNKRSLLGGKHYSAIDLSQGGKRLKEGVVSNSDYLIDVGSLKKRRGKFFYRAWDYADETEVVVRRISPKRFRKNYLIEEKLGVGTQGEALLVWNIKEKRWEVAKDMKGAANFSTRDASEVPHIKRRFKREFDFLSGIEAPGVVSVHSLEEENGLFSYLIGDVGIDLSRFMKKKGWVSWSEIVEIGVQAAKALESVHHHRLQGVVERAGHLDVKPGNLILTEDGEVKLIDFGGAKSTPVRGSSGTPIYMSPQALKSQFVDQREDVFGLGYTLIHLAIGRKIFSQYQNVRQQELLARVTQNRLFPGDLERTREKDFLNIPSPIRLKRGFQDILERATAYFPEDRYQTMAEMYHDLMLFQSDQTVRFEIPFPSFESFVSQLKLRGWNSVLLRLNYWENRTDAKEKKRLLVYRTLLSLKRAALYAERDNLDQWEKKAALDSIYLAQTMGQQNIFFILSDLFILFVKDRSFEFTPSTLKDLEGLVEKLESSEELKRVLANFSGLVQAWKDLDKQREKLLSDPQPAIWRRGISPVEISVLAPLSQSVLRSLRYKDPTVMKHIQECEELLEAGEGDLFFNIINRIPMLDREGKVELLNYYLELFINEYLNDSSLNGALVNAVAFLMDELSGSKVDLRLMRRDGSLFVQKGIFVYSIFPLLVEDVVKQVEENEIDEVYIDILNRCFVVYEIGDRKDWYSYNLDLLERVIDEALSDPESVHPQFFYSITISLRSAPFRDEDDLKRVGAMLEKLHRYVRHQNYYGFETLEGIYLALWDYLKQRMIDRLVAIVRPEQKDQRETKEELEFRNRPKVKLVNPAKEIDSSRLYFKLSVPNISIKSYSLIDFPRRRGSIGEYTVERVGESEEFLIWETANPRNKKRCRRVGNFLVYRSRSDPKIEGGTLYSAHDMRQKGAKLRSGIVKRGQFWVVKDSVQVDGRKKYFRAWDEEINKEVVVQLKKRKSFGKNYFLIEELGRGAFAKVFLAWDRVNKKAVAIKRMLEDSSFSDEGEGSFTRERKEGSFKRAKERFHREYRLQSEIESDHVMRVQPKSRKRVGEYLAFVMDEVGISLREMRRKTRFSFKRVLEMGIQAAEGLKDVHAYKKRGEPQRLIHCDVKPENLILTPEGKVRLSDFGLACSEKENPRGSKGTPFYQSPENLRGGRLDQREDVYGLGATLFFLNSGRHPFSDRARSLPDMIHAKETVDSHEVALNRNFQKYFPSSEGAKGLRDIIRRAMAYYPEDRYQTVAEMQRDLIQLQRNPKSRFPFPLPDWDGIREQAIRSGETSVLERLEWWEKRRSGRYKETIQLYRLIFQIQSARRKPYNLDEWKKVFSEGRFPKFHIGFHSSKPLIRLIYLLDRFALNDGDSVNEWMLSQVEELLGEEHSGWKAIFDSFVRQKGVWEELLERRDRLLQEPAPKVIKGDFGPVDIAV